MTFSLTHYYVTALPILANRPLLKKTRDQTADPLDFFIKNV